MQKKGREHLHTFEEVGGRGGVLWGFNWDRAESLVQSPLLLGENVEYFSLFKKYPQTVRNNVNI